MKSFSPIRKIVRRFTALWTSALLLHKNFRFYFYRNRKPCELLQRLPYVVSREKYDNANSEAKTKSMMRDFKLKLPNNIIRNCRSIFFFAVKCHIRYIRGHQISQALQESSNCVIISRDFALASKP